MAEINEKKERINKSKENFFKKINIMVKLGKNGDDQEKKVCRKR